MPELDAPSSLSSPIGEVLPPGTWPGLGDDGSTVTSTIPVLGAGGDCSYPTAAYWVTPALMNAPPRHADAVPGKGESAGTPEAIGYFCDPLGEGPGVDRCACNFAYSPCKDLWPTAISMLGDEQADIDDATAEAFLGGIGILIHDQQNLFGPEVRALVARSLMLLKENVDLAYFAICCKATNPELMAWSEIISILGRLLDGTLSKSFLRLVLVGSASEGTPGYFQNDDIVASNSFNDYFFTEISTDKGRLTSWETYEGFETNVYLYATHPYFTEWLLPMYDSGIVNGRWDQRDCAAIHLSADILHELVHRITSAGHFQLSAYPGTHKRYEDNVFCTDTAVPGCDPTDMWNSTPGGTPWPANSCDTMHLIDNAYRSAMMDRYLAGVSDCCRPYSHNQGPYMWYRGNSILYDPTCMKPEA